MASVRFSLSPRGPDYRENIARMKRLKERLSKKELGSVLHTELKSEIKGFPVRGTISRQGDVAIFKATVPATKQQATKEKINKMRTDMKKSMKGIVKDSVRRFRT